MTSDPTPGVLSQALTTTAGQRYVVSFALLDESPGTATDSFTVTFGGFSDTITGDTMPGVYKIFTFTTLGSQVTGASTTLSFQGVNDNADWNLDDVSVTPASNIPEPATWALLLVAFAALGARLGVRSSRRPAIARS